MRTHGLRRPHPRQSTFVKCLALALLMAFCALAQSLPPVVRGQSSGPGVVWENPVGATPTGNNLQKTSGQWDSGANSEQRIGSSGGYVEFGVSMNHRMQVGLGNDTSAAVDYTQLKFTFNFWGDYFDIREGWENPYGWWPYQAGDIFRIEVAGGVVRYYRNGVLLRESTRAPSYPLVLDTALTAAGATVQNAVINTGTPPSSGSTTASVKTDFGVYPEPPLPALPAAGQKFTDPTFGTQIMRVTAAGANEHFGTWYTFWPSFNCNSTRLLVRVGGSQSTIYEFDPDTFTLGVKHDLGQVHGLEFLGQSATWSSTDPNLLYGVTYHGSPQKLVAYNASSHSFSDVYDFTANQDLSSGEFLWQMTMSADAKTFAFTVKRHSQQEPVGYLVLRLASATSPGWVRRVTEPGLDEVSLDKTGQYLTVPFSEAKANGDALVIRDLNNDTEVALKNGAPDYPLGHGDFGPGYNVGWENSENDYMRRDFTDPHHPKDVLDVGDYVQSSHLSLTGSTEFNTTPTRGWSLVSFYGAYEELDGDGRFQREVILVRNDPATPNQVVRLLHHRSHYAPVPGPVPDANYWNTPRANMSPDGKYIAFSSNWGGNNPPDMFVARIPPLPTTTTPTPEPVNGTLPSPWERQDIGAVGKAGASGHDNGVFSLHGAGLQIWSGADGFHYVYRQVSGDFDMAARVTRLDFGNVGASAGLMVRDDLTAGSRNAYAAVSRERELFFSQRAAAADNTSAQSAGKNLTTFWLRLSRRGDAFIAYRSDDGTAWQPVGAPRSVVMADNDYAGLAVSGNNTETTRQARFDNVSFTPVAGAAAAPDAPTNLRAVHTEIDSATNRGYLTWNDNSSNETHFVVESFVPGPTGGWKQAAILGPNTTRLDILIKVCGEQYRVRAFNGLNASGYADTEVCPMLPSGPCPASSPLIISEFRLRGAAGARDEYVELYNNSDSAISVCTTDNSGGWTLAARSADGLSTTPIFTLPLGTVIPARAHYLAVNAAPVDGYSLGSYPAGLGQTASGDTTYTTDINDDSGVALFKSSNPANFTASSRLDAAGFGAAAGAVADLYREGTGLDAVGAQNGEHAFVRKLTVASNGLPQDTGDNAADFQFIDADGETYNGVRAKLGAPGPENLSSPVQRNSSITVALLDLSAADSDPPNRERNFTPDPANNSSFGTLAFRRRVTNTTGVNVSLLRFRIVDLTTYPAPAGAADLRARSSGAVQVLVQGVTRTVQGTTLEQPPAQPAGGGLNTSMRVGVVTLAQPLAPGASLDVQFLLGVEKTGSFYFYINVEAAP